MDAVIFNGPWKIDVEKRPIPTVTEPTDAIVKVTSAGICGSELHMYRGHQKTPVGHIMVIESCPALRWMLFGAQILTVGIKSRDTNSWDISNRSDQRFANSTLGRKSSPRSLLSGKS
jgi:hypothetical protein